MEDLFFESEKNTDVYKSCESLICTLSKAQSDLVQCRNQVYNLESMLIRSDDYGNSYTQNQTKQSDDIQLLRCTLGAMRKDKKMFMGKLRSVLNAQLILQNQVKTLQDQISPRGRVTPITNEVLKKGSMLFSEVQALQAHMSVLERELTPLMEKEKKRNDISLSNENVTTIGSNNNNSMPNLFHTKSPVNKNYEHFTREIKNLRAAAELILHGGTPGIKQSCTKVRFDLRHSRRDNFPKPCLQVPTFVMNCEDGYRDDRRRSWPVRRRRYSSSSCSPSPRRNQAEVKHLSPVNPNINMQLKSQERNFSECGSTLIEKDSQHNSKPKSVTSRGTSPDNIWNQEISSSPLLEGTNNNMSSSQVQTPGKIYPTDKYDLCKTISTQNETMDKWAIRSATRTGDINIQTRNIIPYHSAERQSDGVIKPNSSFTKPLIDSSNQTDHTSKQNMITQTETLSIISVGSQSNEPIVRSFGTQIEPTPPPQPLIINNKLTQTESPSKKTKHNQHSKSHDHCSRRYRCKSPIAYYRACNECRCQASPTGQSDEEYY